MYLTAWPLPELDGVWMAFRTLCSIQLTWHLRELRKGHHFFLLPCLPTQTVKELPVCAHSRSEDSHYRAGVFPPYTGPGVSHRDAKTWLNKSALLRHSPPSLALLRFFVHLFSRHTLTTVTPPQWVSYCLFWSYFLKTLVQVKYIK